MRIVSPCSFNSVIILGKRLWPNPPQFLNTIADGIILQQLSHLPFKIICDLVEKDVITVVSKSKDLPVYTVCVVHISVVH